ncbi:hypothetical protein [Bacillus sp. T33-2]|uniref:hypothetical protein n=1 Tax=Bacillus sp. T33-2 TaxID=2054168 RepID=UPI000C78F7FB|nr:hypothetical protein [Bacillus sp. T33-2]PLR97487.1 hypothetical protein CVD19_08335 [Bacillus sp. T33-2]
MNTLLNKLAAFALITAILSGCGTPASPSESSNGGKAEAPETDKQKSPDTEPNSGEGLIRILEQNLQFKVNGETKEDTAFLKHNDNQSYSMYVLPEYELTAEEPNKDVLMLAEDDSIFMRIELLPADADWAMVMENTKAQLSALNSEVKPAAAPTDEFFSNATAFSASNNDETVTAYVIKNAELPLKLTIFSKQGADHSDAFLQMAKTIMVEK